MDKQIMQFKLLSYKQALKKAQEKNDNYEIKLWANNISELQHEIDQIIQLYDHHEEVKSSSFDFLSKEKKHRGDGSYFVLFCEKVLFHL